MFANDNELDNGLMRFCRVYAEATTDPYEVRNCIDLEEVEDPMERAAQEVYRMIHAGMWAELAENLENATIYSN